MIEKARFTLYEKVEIFLPNRNQEEVASIDNEEREDLNEDAHT